MRRIVLVLAGCIAAAAALFIVLRPRPLNVLLITVDTLRADHLSIYGYTQQHTPSIDALAGEGTRFTNAFCDVTWTTPSMSSVMTGTYAIHHGMTTTYRRLSEDNVTLAEVLRDHGYQTGAVIGSFPLDHVYGLNQGFETYDDRFTAPLLITKQAVVTPVPSRWFADPKTQREFDRQKQIADSRRPGPEVTRVASDWLHQARRPFFLWVHYFGPHGVSDQRRPGLANLRAHLDEYPREVVEADSEVGALLEALARAGHADDTVVVFHSDHGENLGEHQDVGHGKNLYEPVMRIPLIIRAPRVSPGGVVSGLARNVDIFPTLLELVGITYTGRLDGRSLVPALRADGETETTEVYSETYLTTHETFAERVTARNGKPVIVGHIHRGLRTDAWKFIAIDPAPVIDRPDLPFAPNLSPHREELYNLRSDPDELHDLITTDPVTAARFRARLETYTRSESRPEQPLDADQDKARERLRALGYVE